MSSIQSGSQAIRDSLTAGVDLAHFDLGIPIAQATFGQDLQAKVWSRTLNDAARDAQRLADRIDLAHDMSVSKVLRRISRFQSAWWTGQPWTVQPSSQRTLGRL